MPSIQANNIVKTYKQDKKIIPALNGISLTVNEGELFGLIGPDGAGKTSLIRILTTLIKADTGEAIVNGNDVIKDYKKIRNRIGYMPGKFSLYQDLSVEENLTFFASIFKTTPADNYELYKDIYIQLEPFKDRRAGKLSGGMKQKLALCCALVHRPDVLFLDEPTTGVDAVSRKEFWHMLSQLKAQGISILVSTPYMDEATLCDRIALIENGRFLGIDTPEKIIDSFTENLFAIKSDSMYPLLLELREFSDIESVYPFGEYYHITLKGEIKVENLIEKLQQKHTGILWKKINAGIEDVFLKEMTHAND